jgi:hypothetical protein
MLTGEKTMSITGAATDPHHIPCAVCYSQDAYDKYTENDKCASLKASGGVYGGGSEAIAIQQTKRSEHYAREITKE